MHNCPALTGEARHPLESSAAGSVENMVSLPVWDVSMLRQKAVAFDLVSVLRHCRSRRVCHCGGAMFGKIGGHGLLNLSDPTLGTQ